MGPGLGCSFLTDTVAVCALCFVTNMFWLMEPLEKVVDGVGREGDTLGPPEDL